GEHLSDLLLEKRREGVQVALIFDSFGSAGTPASFFDKLRGAGVMVLKFNPLNPLEARSGYSPNDRDHRKILVVDGSAAIVGGVNLSRDKESGSLIRWETRQNSPPQYWRDPDMKIEGPAVAQVQRLFLQTWQQQKGPALEDAGFFPTVPPKG